MTKYLYIDNNGNRKIYGTMREISNDLKCTERSVFNYIQRKYFKNGTIEKITRNQHENIINNQQNNILKKKCIQLQKKIKYEDDKEKKTILIKEFKELLKKKQ